MLECLEVTKSYGSTLILQIPSLKLDPGIYWIKGSNGSGKTTFLQMVAGLLPFRGDIVLQSHNLHRSPVAFRRCVSWSDAEPLYPGFLSGRDLVSFYQSIRKAPQKQIDTLTDLFGVRPYLAAPTGTYSSGMIKKLSLLLAFIGSPALIALDEPLVTLDQEAIPALYGLIRESWSKQQTGFLISSHQDLAGSGLPIKNILHLDAGTISLS